MKKVTDRACGYCGTTYSKSVSHGKVIQNAWYKDDVYGYLCRKCHQRKETTGSPINYLNCIGSVKFKYYKRANLELYGTDWQCIDILVRFSSNSRKKSMLDEVLTVKRYTLQCRKCGRTVFWSGDIESFLKSRESKCDCVVLPWVIANSDLLDRKHGAQAIAARLVSEAKTDAEIAREMNLTRERIGQVHRQMRAVYFAMHREDDTNGET